MLTITTGRLKGRKLHPVSTGALDRKTRSADKTVNRSAADLRPTTGMVREAVFNLLQSRLQQARFLDLFAGTGIMGFEAVSRGAARVVSVEADLKHARAIVQAQSHLGVLPTEYQLWTTTAEGFLEKGPLEHPFDIIFLDPPYDYPEASALLEKIVKTSGWLAKDGILLYEQRQSGPLNPGFERRKYGNTVLDIFRY